MIKILLILSPILLLLPAIIVTRRMRRNKTQETFFTEEDIPVDYSKREPVREIGPVYIPPRKNSCSCSTRANKQTTQDELDYEYPYP